MKTDPCYSVACRVVLATLEEGQVVGTRQIEHQVQTDSAEITEVFTELYERFRSPQLLGLHILHIQADKAA